jgi:hypothetical protein
MRRENPSPLPDGCRGRTHTVAGQRAEDDQTCFLCPRPARGLESAFQCLVKRSPRDVERFRLEGQIVKALDDCTVLTYDGVYAYP